MLVVSVIVIAVVAAAYVFVPSFGQGVEKLGQDVRQILSMGDIGGVGRGGGSSMGNTSTANSEGNVGGPSPSGPGTFSPGMVNGAPIANDPGGGLGAPAPVQ